MLLAYEFRGELFDDLAYFDAANALFECEAIPLLPYEGEQVCRQVRTLTLTSGMAWLFEVV